MFGAFMEGRFAVILVAALLIVPSLSYGFPFGGQTQVHHYCYNQAIYALLSPPRGGPYIWTPSTKTYQFGPPRGVGQWLLGLTGPPYYCVVTRSPIFVKEGMSIMMMGSSGAAAPSYRAPTGGGLFPTSPSPSPSPTPSPSPSPTPPSPGPTTLGRVLISEVFGAVDSARGNDPQHEWVEIYNGSRDAVDLSGWTLADASSTDSIPQGVTLAPGKLLVITATSTLRTYWSWIPSDVRIVALDTAIGNGLSPAGDRVTLLQGQTIIDTVSWGANSQAFSPAATVLQSGRSLARTSFSTDTDTAQDWVHRTPNPGQ